jgi:hypothetical protein
MTFPIPPDFPVEDHPIFKAMIAARRRLLRRDAAALRELAGMYEKALTRLRVDRNALLKVIREVGPDRNQLIRLASFENLIQGVQREMGNLAKEMAGKLADEIAVELAKAAEDGLLLVQRALPGLEAAYIKGKWVFLNPDQVTTMFGFLDTDGPLIAGIRTNYGSAMAEFVREAIATGFISGMNPRDVARLINGAMGEGLHWAMVTARTAHLWAYRAANHQSFLNNSWVVQSWIWFAQLDDRVCMSCVAEHGSEHPLTEILGDHHQGRCIAGDTIVSGPATMSLISRYYQGDLVIIRTASGKLLSVTPNHPILTSRGWLAAGILQAGDNVIGYTLDEGAARRIDPNKYQVPTLIEDIARTPGMLRLGSVPTTPEDFHGDGCGSDVYVVWANRLLSDTLNAAHSEPIFEQGFSGGNADLPLLSGSSGLDLLSERHGFSPYSVLRELNPPAMLIDRGLFGQQPVGVRAASHGNFRSIYAVPDGCTRHVELFGERIGRVPFDVESNNLIIGQAGLRPLGGPVFFSDNLITDRARAQQPASLEFMRETLTAGVEKGGGLLGALASQIELDSILEVNVTHFSGHVYNLHNAEGWYNANGIVTHNCTPMPHTKSYAELGFPDILDLRPVVEKGEVWFGKQPSGVQRLLMGPGKLSAWKAGQFDFSQLTVPYQDPVYGRMLKENSLKGILGADLAQLFYGGKKP